MSFEDFFRSEIENLRRSKKTEKTIVVRSDSSYNDRIFLFSFEEIFHSSYFSLDFLIILFFSFQLNLIKHSISLCSN